MKVKTDFGTYDVRIKMSEYRHGGGLAVLLEELDGAPFATLTVNLDNHPTAGAYAYVDINNCPWAMAFIEQYELGTYTGMLGYSGYCQYPLYEFDLDKLLEFTNER